jgi:hypothetical protein
MYLLGHADPTLTMRVYQQVIDMGEGGLQTSRSSSDARSTRLSHRFPAGGFGNQWQPAGKNASQPETWSGLEGAETAR